MLELHWRRRLVEGIGVGWGIGEREREEGGGGGGGGELGLKGNADWRREG